MFRNHFGYRVSLDFWGKKKSIFVIWIIFSIALSYIFTKGISSSYGISVINDEFGYWGIAASWAGKDWNELLSATPYYSYGYSFIITLLFKLFSNPQVLYRCALFINLFFILGSFGLTYLCGRYLFKNNSPLLVMGVSFAVTLYSNNVTQAKIAWTESLLYLLYWFLAFCVIKILQKPKSIWIILFSVANIYIYYVHQRTVGVVISSSVLLIFLVILKKINLKQFLIFVFILSLGLWEGNLLKNFIKDELFTNKDLTVWNDYGGQVFRIKYLFSSLEGFFSLIISILGKLFYLGASTCLFAFIAIEKLCKYFFGAIIKGTKTFSKNLNNEWLFAFYILLSFASLFGISAIAMYDSAGRYDSLVYGRYMELAFGPLLLIGIMSLLNNKVTIYEVLALSGILIVLSVVVNAEFISMIDDNASFNSICSVTLAYFFGDGSKISNVSFWISIYMITVLLMFWAFSLKGKAWVSIVAIFALIGIWGELSDYVNVKIENQQQSINSGIGLISEKIEELEGGYNIRTISAVDENEGYSKYLQYYLAEYMIEEVDTLKGENRENIIYIACINDNVIKNLLKEYYILYKDNNYIIFTPLKSEELINDWKNNVK